jgi:hypothetical protein
MGAVPFQDAKCPRLAKRLTSAMSPISRAAPEGPMPCSWLQTAAGGLDQFGQLPIGVLDLLVDDSEFGGQLAGQLASGTSDDVAGPDRVQQGTGLRGRQVSRRNARRHRPSGRSADTSAPPP